MGQGAGVKKNRDLEKEKNEYSLIIYL